MKEADQLKVYYAKANDLSSEFPAQLSQKIYILTQALGLIGKFHAQAVQAHDSAYAERKRILAETYLTSTGKQSDRTARAERAAYKVRLFEAETDGEATKWHNCYTSTQEQINALKLMLKSEIADLESSGDAH